MTGTGTHRPLRLRLKILELLLRREEERGR